MKGELAFASNEQMPEGLLLLNYPSVGYADTSPAGEARARHKNCQLSIVHCQLLIIAHLPRVFKDLPQESIARGKIAWYNTRKLSIPSPQLSGSFPPKPPLCKGRWAAARLGGIVQKADVRLHTSLANILRLP